MKDIRNYLQFYIGQECEMTLFGTKYKAIFTGFNSDYYFVHVQGDRASITQNDYSKMKLSLRKLSSMTEEEAEQWIKMDNKRFARGEALDWFVQINDAEKTAFLLYKGFDLFGLIDDNLAIDKLSTIKEG